MAKDTQGSYAQKKWEHAVAEHKRMKDTLARTPAASHWRAYAEGRIKELEAAYPGRLSSLTKESINHGHRIS